MKNILKFDNVTNIYHTVRGEVVAAKNLMFFVDVG